MPLTEGRTTDKKPEKMMLLTILIALHLLRCNLWGASPITVSQLTPLGICITQCSTFKVVQKIWTDIVFVLFDSILQTVCLCPTKPQHKNRQLALKQNSVVGWGQAPLTWQGNRTLRHRYQPYAEFSVGINPGRILMMMILILSAGEIGYEQEIKMKVLLKTK